MKLAKKMLAGVLALAMVAALALTAFAAGPVTLTYSATDAVVGKEVTVTVSGTGLTGVGAGALAFKFDNTALEYVSSTATDAAKLEGITIVGGLQSGSTDTVGCGIMVAESITKDMAFFTMTFKVLKAGDTSIEVTAKDWSDAEENEVTVNASNIAISAKDPAAATTAAPTTAAAEKTTAVAEDGSNKADSTTAPNKITQTGEAGIAAIAGVMAIAAVAFVATRKKDEE